MLRRLISLGVLAGVLWLFPSLSFAQEYKIGVLANRGAGQAFQEWNATAEYLSAKLGKPFTIVPLDDKQLPAWTKEGKIDFLYTNPAMYAELNKLHGVQAVATLVNQVKSVAVDQAASAIIVKRESPIKTLADFKGKDFMCRGRSAFGGWLMAKRLFVESGMNPEKDFLSLRDMNTHDNVVYAVYNGVVHGGAVRTGTLEKMAQEGKIKLEDFRVIHQISDNFPFIHSTQLYPEYPMAVCSHVPSAVKTEVAQALHAMTPSDRAASAANMAGWKKPLDYSPVVECLTLVQYGAFEKQGGK